MIMNCAAKLNIYIKLTDLQRLVTSELQNELKKMMNENENNDKTPKRGRAYEEFNAKEKQTQNLFGVHSSNVDPS